MQGRDIRPKFPQDYRDPFYTRALRAASGQGPAGRCRLLHGLGLAQLHGFDLAAGSSTLREAASAARAAGDPT